MLRRDNAETELWRELTLAQEEYTRALASLDTQFFDPSSPDMNLLEQTAEVRRSAYGKYRRAMADLAGSFSGE